jgi:exosortase/archaeosortase family protein
MRAILKRTHGLVALQLAAFWPVWKWYLLRMTDGSDEPWGVVALITCAAISWNYDAGEDREGFSLLIPGLLTLLYAGIRPFAPNLILAAVAVTACGSLIGRLRFGERINAAFFGLLLISLPVAASLQFHLGYPMRIISGEIASALLRLAGLHVVLDGACLRWGAQLVSIDAPCSGVRMLWAGAYLALAAAFHYRLTNFRTVVAVAASGGAVLIGNGIRAAALFHMETGLIPLPAWFHPLIGLVAFGGTALVVVITVNRIAGGSKCVAEPSS